MIVYNNQQQLTGHCSFQEYSVLLQSPPRNNGYQGQHAIITHCRCLCALLVTQYPLSLLLSMTHHFHCLRCINFYCLTRIIVIVYDINFKVELAWRSGSVMDCHTTARGSFPGGNGLFTELHVLHKGQSMGVPPIKMTSLLKGRKTQTNKQTNQFQSCLGKKTYCTDLWVINRQTKYRHLVDFGFLIRQIRILLYEDKILIKESLCLSLIEQLFLVLVRCHIYLVQLYVFWIFWYFNYYHLIYCIQWF